MEEDEKEQSSNSKNKKKARYRKEPIKQKFFNLCDINNDVESRFYTFIFEVQKITQEYACFVYIGHLGIYINVHTDTQ